MEPRYCLAVVDASGIIDQVLSPSTTVQVGILYFDTSYSEFPSHEARK